MGFFKKAHDTYKLQRDARSVKKELQNIHVESEENGTTVTVNAELEVLNVEIAPEACEAAKKDALEKTIVKLLNKALKKGQQIAAEKMKTIMDQMGMGGPATA